MSARPADHAARYAGGHETRPYEIAVPAYFANVHYCGPTLLE